MLILTRKRREAILIALEGKFNKEETIEIRIINIEGGRISIGIQAPDKYRIKREELKDAQVDSN